MHAGQDEGAWVGGALTDQEVAVLQQQLLCVAAAHHAVVPRLALQLLLRPEGQRANQQGAGVVHRRRLVEGGGLRLALPLGQRVGLRLDGVLKGLWGQKHGGDAKRQIRNLAVQLLPEMPTCNLVHKRSRFSESLSFWRSCTEQI